MCAMALSRREVLILGSVAAAAAVAGGVVGALALQRRTGAGHLLAAAFPDLSGKPTPVAHWRGKALVCNFWATWCAPCREEIPLLDAVQQRHGAQLQVLGIAIDNAANVAKFAESVRIGYPLLVAGSAGIDLMARLGNNSGALPFTVLLDRRGRLAGRKLGAYSAAELDREMVALLQ